ncbi:hypothetical protein C8J56DRAFT_1057520 [Mycena floridula]|nr:hypothetical protein C8J56DRAFT_1057520 [Mycena floridula]
MPSSHHTRERTPPQQTPSSSPLVNITPSKSSHELCQLVDINTGDSSDSENENKKENDEPVSKKSRCDVDSALIQAAKKLGRRFVLQYLLWLELGADTFDVEWDDNYDPVERFDSNEDLIQGQLQDLYACILKKYHEDMIACLSFRMAFVTDMSQQCSNTSSCLQGSGAPYIFGEYEKFMSSSSSREKKLKALKPDPAKALIRGPKGPRGLMEGHPFRPAMEIMKGKHHIQHTTPGAIAGAAVLARWALSPDDQLKSPGDHTGINYQKDFDEYLQKLLTGLRAKKRWTKQLFAYWDNIIFPNHILKYGGKTTGNDKDAVWQMELDEAAELDAEASNESSEDEDVGQQGENGDEPEHSNAE